ncbi:hypothetical protein RB195_004352 [Necator americanus]|uniref:Thrombospondin type 1 domain protein n=1 Tax=Necator americanus TaxID=51031 RepID=A0ABR1BLN5_NECAM
MGRLAYQLSATVGALCLFIPLTDAQTSEPEWAPTGKLNQFKGFATPRPLPPNAQFEQKNSLVYALVYTSVWAGWSSWSFCSNGVRMRVRACNTVKGFNCLGPNKEFTPCDGSNRRIHGNHAASPSDYTDYDIVDPYEADRREAMRQLYPDDHPEKEDREKNPNFVVLSAKSPSGSAPGSFRAHAAEPIRESSMIDITKAASELPEATADVESLNPKWSPLSSVDSSRETFKWVENPEYDWGGLESAHKAADSSKTMNVQAEPDPGMALIVSTSPMPMLPDRLLSTAKNDENAEQLIDLWLFIFVTVTYSNSNEDDRASVEHSDFQKNQHLAVHPPAHPSEERGYGPPGPRQFAVKTTPVDKDVERSNLEDQGQLQLHREEIDAALSSLQIREEGRTSGSPKRQPDVRVWDVSELTEPVNKTRGSNDFSKWRKEADITKKSLAEPEDEEKKDERTDPVGVVHEREKTVRNVTVVAEELPELKLTEPPTTTQPITTTSLPVLDDEEHFEQFGTRPQLVQPKLNRNDISDDAVPELVVPVGVQAPRTLPTTLSEPTEPITTAPQTSTIATEISREEFATASATTLQEVTTSFQDKRTESQKDINDERILLEPRNPLTYKVNKNYNGLSKEIPENAVKSKKMKGFGFTGFFIRKNRPTAKKHVLHDGESTPKVSTPVRTTTRRVTRPTTTTTRAPLLEEELSPDTLHALDWMLQNITKIAERGDEAFMRALEVNAQGHPNVIDVRNRNVFVPESAELVVPYATIRRPEHGKKLKKTKKSKKGQRKGLSKKRKAKKVRDLAGRAHYGEYKPTHVDKTRIFPKFKSTITMANRARSFGIRTVTDDKDETQWDQAVIDEAIEAASQKGLGKKGPTTTEDPARLVEEIKALQGIMNNIEENASSPAGKKVSYDETDDTEPQSNYTKVMRSAMDLSLIPSQHGFVPGYSEEFHQQPMHVITEGTATVAESYWSEWGSWAECFCGKQVRTRRCIYSGPMSSGCKGNSYESRSCSGGQCPVPTEANRPELITTESPQQTPASPTNPRRHFRPLKLHTATSLS